MIIPEAEYRRICGLLPIACVDLLVTDPAERVLLLRRSNEPASGQWWFPGGRVHHGERRVEAALRKLAQETGLAAEAPPLELLTEDVIFPGAAQGASHGITTVFHFRVRDARALRLDPQSTGADWRAPAAWRAEGLHPFVAAVLARPRSG